VTLRTWLDERSPRPPERLARRIDEVLGDALESADDDAAARSLACIGAAEALLRDLLSRRTAGRESALDLLTVDALATYAFEAASKAPETIPDRAAAAMRRFAAIARK
jgi:hypothetical protein